MVLFVFDRLFSFLFKELVKASLFLRGEHIISRELGPAHDESIALILLYLSLLSNFSDSIIATYNISRATRLSFQLCTRQSTETSIFIAESYIKDIK